MIYIKNLIIVIVVVAVIGVGAFYMLSSKPQESIQTMEGRKEDNSNMSSAPSMMLESSESGAAEDSIKEFTVTGSNFKFSQPEIRVKEGDTVKITFKNESGHHDFVIDEFNVATEQTNGPTEEIVTFVADKTGTFEYYCSVLGHKQLGMKGKLIVE